MCCAVVLTAARAAAHPDVDAGRARYAEADLAGALDAFARAEASEDLARDELIVLLESRVLVHMALGDDASAERDLASLASLSPDHAFGREVPPSVVQTFERIRTDARGPLALHIEAAAEGDTVLLRAEVANDATGLVREVRLHHRSAEGAYETTSGSEATVRADEAGVEYWGEAIGPGGAVLAAHGSAAEPLRTGSSAVLDRAAHEPSGGVAPWIWIAGGLAAVGLVVLVAVLASSGGDDVSTQTQPSYPRVEF